MASFLRLNLTANSYLAPALGYPFRIGPQTESEARGVVPGRASTIVATVYADKQCDVHMALLCAPLLENGPDSEVLLQVDSLAVMISPTAITLAVPVNTSAVAIAPSGTITLTAASQSVTGAGTAFPLDGSWNGYEIQAKNGTWYQIASVQSATALTLNMPTGLIVAGAGAFYVRRPVPVAYILRLWMDNVVGGTVETIARDPSITNIVGQPQIPGNLNVSSIVVS